MRQAARQEEERGKESIRIWWRGGGGSVRRESGSFLSNLVAIMLDRGKYEVRLIFGQGVSNCLSSNDELGGQDAGLDFLEG